jgi:endonuclease YncB( thermonuclease family)
VKDWLALIVLLAAASPTLAQTIDGTGTAHGFAVSDGDTVKFGKQLIRLFGIDAPERLQPCDDGKWFPGPLATEALVRIIAGRPVSCRQVDYDRKNNRPVAQCYAGDDDLQEQMVLAGWAWVYTGCDGPQGRRSRSSLPAAVGVARAKTG